MTLLGGGLKFLLETMAFWAGQQHQKRSDGLVFQSKIQVQNRVKWSMLWQMPKTLQFLYSFLIDKHMGNQELSVPDQMSRVNLDILCSLTQQAYAQDSLQFDPFLPHQRISSQATLSTYAREIDLEVSQMVDEVAETQTPLSSHQEEERLFFSSPLEMGLTLQKNFSQKRKMIKKKASPAEVKKAGKGPQTVEEQESEESDCQERKENLVEGRIRDQNNCKSYHKLVKNYLVSKKLGHLIQPFEKDYPTKYYFVIALILIRHHLQQDFTPIYQQIADREVQAQQNKIQRKRAELSKLTKQIRTGESVGADCSALLVRSNKLVKQIDHIQVLQRYIGNYSTRSCAAFFQGNTEESLRILYVKDDAQMKKRYYFSEALLILQEIETQVRKVNSHA